LSTGNQEIMLSGRSLIFSYVPIAMAICEDKHIISTTLFFSRKYQSIIKKNSLASKSLAKHGDTKSFIDITAL